MRGTSSRSPSAAWADILAGGETEEPGLALLDDEQENLHAALAWAVETANVDAETRLRRRAAVVLARARAA